MLALPIVNAHMQDYLCYVSKLLVEGAGNSGWLVGGHFGADWKDYDLDFAPG
jgi:hypothetical protein